VQGGPHENLIAGKAVAFGEALKPEFHTYSKQVVKNAQTMVETFQSHGCKIVSGGTDNHLLLLDIYASFGVDGKTGEKVLEDIGLSVNKNMVPYDTRPPMNPSGIRIGTPAATTRGMKEAEMQEIAEIIIEALKNTEEEQVLLTLRERVLTLSKKFPLYV